MDWKKYRVVFTTETEGENSIGQEESWRSVRYCNVTALQGLKKGDQVPFEPSHNGTPNINFKRLTDETVELTYHNYDGPNDSSMTAHDVVLRVGEGFCDYNSIGRYSSSYDIYLEEIK